MPKLLLLAALGFLTVGCGSSPTSSPAAPTTPTTTSLTIAGNDAIRTGFFALYTATANLSNGTKQDVTTSTSWTSNNGSVAAVDTTTPGKLLGNANGTTTLTASYQGVSASKSVSIVNNYGGSWTLGTYVVNKCDQAGAFAGYCDALGPGGGIGAVLPFALTLDQSISNDRTGVSGTLTLGGFSGNVSGTVQGDGSLVIGGTFPGTAGGVSFAITVGGWSTRLSGASGMVGGWAQSIAAPNIAGNAYQENLIRGVTHSSAQDAGRAPVPASHFASLSDLFNRMR